MDGGSFRGQQPSDRRTINRSTGVPASSPRQPEAPQVASAEPKTPHRAPAHHQKKEKKRRRWPLVVILTVLLLGIGGWFAWTSIQNANTGIDSSKYQAVFFTNGQVYFGKLKGFNSDYLKLTDIYYLQTQPGADESGNPQQASDGDGNVQLIKLGDEIHGPEDEMVISKDQVLFYENLKADSRVAQSISQFKNKN